MTLEELERSRPGIHWREPLPVIWRGEGDPLRMEACRVCIANYGLKRDSQWQWPTPEEAIEHLHEHHGADAP